MRASISSAVALSLGTLVATAPSSSGCQPIENLSKRQNRDWAFDLCKCPSMLSDLNIADDGLFAQDQNTRCTGQVDRKEGAGSIGCTQGILNGSALAYIKIYLEDGCTVRFYNQPGCPANAAAGVITVGTPTGECQRPLNGQIVAYAVTCN